MKKKKKEILQNNDKEFLPAKNYFHTQIIEFPLGILKFLSGINYPRVRERIAELELLQLRVYELDVGEN